MNSHNTTPTSINKPEAKSQSKPQIASSQIQKREWEFGLWGVTKILFATHLTTFRVSMWKYMVQIPAQSSPEYPWSFVVDSKREKMV